MPITMKKVNCNNNVPIWQQIYEPSYITMLKQNHDYYPYSEKVSGIKQQTYVTNSIFFWKRNKKGVFARVPYRRFMT